MELEQGLSTQPDHDSSTQDYAGRFGGTVGKWLLEVQDEATRSCLADLTAAAVLEPGGGHGQNIAVLSQAGFQHHILSSPGCPQVMIEPALSEGKIHLTEGSLEQFPFEDRTFPVVISYRILAHIRDWEHYVAELCRVADRRVIVDYPTLRSFNILTESLYHLKKGVESNTRPYRIFKEQELKSAFESHGFEVSHRVGQFFWPMAVHRGLKKPGLSRVLERTSQAIGLRALFGSPVIAAFDRRKV